MTSRPPGRFKIAKSCRDPNLHLRASTRFGLRELALILAMGIGASLKDMNLQSDAAKVLVEAPAGEATALVAAFVTLDAGLSPYVHLMTQKKSKS